MRIILCTLLFMLVSCNKAEIVQPPVDPYASLTPKNVIELCDRPEENYFFPLFDDFYLITRHSNCAGVEDLFSIMWPGEMREKQEVSSRLLTILYVESQEDKLRYKFIKKHKGDENYSNAMYFELSKVPEVKPKSELKDVRN